MHFQVRNRGGRSGRKLGPTSFRFLGVIFCAFSVFVAFVFVRDINLAKASATWPTVSGTVKSSRVSTSTRKGKTKHHFDITYEFAVNGQAYTGTRVRFGGAGTSKSSAEELVKRYPGGSTVTVHYFPDDPSDCTLETGAGGERYAVLAFPGVFFLVGIGMLIGSFYMKPQPTAGQIV